MLTKAISRNIRCLSTSSRNMGLAMAFDVDGVLLRGKEPIPGAKEALDLLDKHNIPYMLLTNGGGYTEEDKARQISQVLQRPVPPERLQLAHTPFRALATTLADEEVLVVGKRRVHHIARTYGFKRTFDVLDVQHAWPGLFPDWSPPHKHIELDPLHADDDLQPRKPTCLRAALVFMDPLHYHRDLQLLVDVLRSSGVPPGDDPSQPVQCHVAGPDLEYVTEWPLPRFGAGIFGDTLSRLFRVATGRDLRLSYYGKPHTPTYLYATQQLAALAGRPLEPGSVVMVGDNPLSDIAGANAHGWRSVLVQTGMYRGEPLSHGCEPTLHARSAREAVEKVLCEYI